jgi:hypothetical protein
MREHGRLTRRASRGFLPTGRLDFHEDPNLPFLRVKGPIKVLVKNNEWPTLPKKNSPILVGIIQRILIEPAQHLDELRIERARLR